MKSPCLISFSRLFLKELGTVSPKNVIQGFNTFEHLEQKATLPFAISSDKSEFKSCFRLHFTQRNFDIEP